MSKNKKQSSNWREQRCFHAVELKRQGWKQVDIATALKVSKGAVSNGFPELRYKEKKH